MKYVYDGCHLFRVKGSLPNQRKRWNYQHREDRKRCTSNLSAPLMCLLVVEVGRSYYLHVIFSHLYILGYKN